MEFISDELLKYAEDYSTNESDVLKALNRYTHANVLQPRMLSGHLQGRFLAMVSKMIKPDCILEIGTYTGYSALCLAEGLSEQGKLITIDVNAELEFIIKQHIEASGYNNKIDLIIGDALKVIPQLNFMFDLVFIDADKHNYLNYYNMVLPKVKQGGFILADNVLWSGKVLNQKEIDKDKDTKAIHEFNNFIKNDERVECMLLPLRDGLMMIRKK
ncbi:MAG: O-methyltransferase [Bacteroidia bacterium]